MRLGAFLAPVSLAAARARFAGRAVVVAVFALEEPDCSFGSVMAVVASCTIGLVGVESSVLLADSAGAIELLVVVPSCETVALLETAGSTSGKYAGGGVPP